MDGFTCVSDQPLWVTVVKEFWMNFLETANFTGAGADTDQGHLRKKDWVLSYSKKPEKHLLELPEKILGITNDTN